MRQYKNKLSSGLAFSWSAPVVQTPGHLSGSLLAVQLSCNTKSATCFASFPSFDTLQSFSFTASISDKSFLFQQIPTRPLALTFRLQATDRPPGV
ncbi:hypothetical protein RRG08_030551 [Elysia crispata]|uniref:Uncharacterized protein n=1 Tax=Elysia crispata TaxID=231223 RepID=A0AAE0ZNK5_9GAST|nr:hypothetical protein RRG08_030551 [Elysia crispata]